MNTQPQFPEHPHRKAMQDEVHARPPLIIAAERSEVWHWVLTRAYDDEAWPEQITPEKRHQVIDLDGGLLRVEHHTEFVALTYCGDASPAPHIWDVVAACPGELLTGVRIIITPDAPELARQHSVGSIVNTGSSAADGVRIETDLRVRDNGMIEYMLTGSFEDGTARGRLAKQILDLDTYRMAALLSFPLVRESTPQLQKLEYSAVRATQQLSLSDDGDLGRNISTLSGILSEVGALHETVRFRLAASRAYYDLVQARLSRLDETPIGQLQTLESFIDFRLTPAIKTINAFERRLNELSTNVHSSMALARTRLDLIAQQQNQSLLRSMERRARQQVQLSQAVEGLSTAAITYYAVGLLAYVLSAIPDTIINTKLVIALAVPVIAIVVWTLTRRASHQFKQQDQDTD
jgi:uncharacterized membrane-anchored protein